MYYVRSKQTNCYLEFDGEPMIISEEMRKQTVEYMKAFQMNHLEFIPVEDKDADFWKINTYYFGLNPND